MIAIATDPRVKGDPIWKEVAEVMRPREKVRPSDWVEKHRTLEKGRSPKPGPFRCDYLPWIKPILDCFVDEPTKLGWVFMKPTQVAGTEMGVSMVGYLADQLPNPMGFVATKQAQARKFSIERFAPMIKGSPRLSSIFLSGRENHPTLDYKPFHGGTLYLVGSGSENDLISNPMAYVFLDELDRLKDFADMGSALEIAQRRTSEYKTQGRTGIFMWAHPTLRSRGAAMVFYEQSDEREWTIECPNCSCDFVPRWSQVKIVDRDPDTAEHRCPHCDDVITDGERWMATEAGRFVSQIEDEDERRKRPFIGFHVSQMCHPRKTLRELAVEFCKCTSESQLQVFFNMIMGEPYLHASFLITEEMINGKIGTHRLPGRALGGAEIPCPEDTRFITSGVDVQKGKADTLLYARISAWTQSGNEHVLWYGKLTGFRTLDRILAGFEAVTPGGKIHKVVCCAIDWGWKARDVFAFCRQMHGGCRAIPVKHAGHVQPSDPIKRDETIDPDRPQLGKLQRLSLCRDHWMDRQLRRLTADPTIGGSVLFPLGVDAEFRNQIKAAILTEEEDTDGYPRLRWKKPDKLRDDHLQAGVYGEVAAVAVGLDRFEELEEDRRERAKKRSEKVKSNVRKHGKPWVPNQTGWV